jgi:hypothetical protein
MHFQKRSTLAIATMVALGGVPSVARADLLGPGGTVIGPTLTTFFGGTLLASLSGPLSPPGFTGSGVTVVVRNASGTLDFYYQLSTVAGGKDGPNRITGFDYDSYLTDVFQIANGSAIGAGFVNGSIASLSADRAVSGSTVGFNFSNALFTPGQTSLAFVIRTNATTFTSGSFGAIDGGGATLAGFAPTGPVATVPEPSTIVLLGTGILGLAGYVRRRKRYA